MTQIPSSSTPLRGRTPGERPEMGHTGIFACRRLVGVLQCVGEAQCKVTDKNLPRVEHEEAARPMVGRGRLGWA